MAKEKTEIILQSIKEQEFEAQNVISTQKEALTKVVNLQRENEETLANIDTLIAECNSYIEENAVCLVQDDDLSLLDQLSSSLSKSFDEKSESNFEHLSPLEFDKDCSIDEFYQAHISYANEHNLDLSKKISSYFSVDELKKLDQQIKDDFTYKKPNCDKYDYMIAGTVGVISGIIDIVFVGIPKTGKLTGLADSATNKLVEKMAKLVGWKGPAEGKDPTKSAIGYLERNYKVNYDQAKGPEVGNLFNLAPKNHHIKSIGHWPDLVGLVFSIINQFANTSSFVDSGRLITIKTDQNDFELIGSNFISKIFCGFCNWLFHILSDAAGSSGVSSRGSGVPIPFFGLFQFINIGEFGQYRNTFGQICVKVFQEGYDARHGGAMAVPVLFTEISIRIMFFVRRFFINKNKLEDSLPSGANPELRRMLLVGHGTMCALDITDATLRSGGNVVGFLLRTNLIGWVRFGQLAYKELLSSIHAGHIDPDAVDEYFETELKRMINN